MEKDPFQPVLPSIGNYGHYSGGGGGMSSESDSEDNSDTGDIAMDTMSVPHQSEQQMRKPSVDYLPSSHSEASSESGSDDSRSSSTSVSESEHLLQRQVSRPRIQKRVRIMEVESDSDNGVTTHNSVQRRVNTTNHDTDHDTDYDLCPPRRRAARNVNYSEFYHSDDSDRDDHVVRRRPKRHRDSESEFEASVGEDSPPSSDSLSDDLTSEDDYLPRARRRAGKKRGKEWEDDSDSDYMPQGGQRRGRKGQRRRRRRSSGYEHTFIFASEASDSSESEFDPGRERQKKKKQPASDFIRMTSRKRGVVSYKEESDVTDSEMVVEYRVEMEDNREKVEKVLKARTGRVGDVGNSTTIYAHREGNSPNDDLSCGTELQYLVKWVNWSHLHNTWETEASLLFQNVKGMKRFYNYIKREEERQVWEREANPEDVEYFKCQEELVEQLLEQYTHVERVIAARNSDDGSQEYLCKWRGLPYSECTWEDSSLVSERFQTPIDAFLDRNNSDCIPNRNAKVLRHRPKFSIMKEQLRWLGPTGVKLRDYQLDGVNWLTHSWCKGNSVILADEMGLGKTIQTIAFLHNLYHEHSLYGPFIIVVPLSTMPGWQREFELWAPEMNLVVYIGDVSSRDKIREYEWAHPNRRLKFNVILTTYEILLKDKVFLSSVSWAVLVVDEAHRLKNDDSLLYRTLMDFRTNHRLLITGTPLQNSLKELWSLLHFIMEKRFLVWEEFEAEHRAYGEGDASSLTSLHQQLQPFLLRRVKKDVEKSLPAKVEQILRVEMSSVQKQYYRWILTKNYKALSKGVKGSITGFINIVMEMKKCCNHTWIVRTDDEIETSRGDRLQALIRGSGKLYLLDKLLVRLREKGHRVLIFSQMVRMLDILAEYMQLRHFPFQRLDGSIRGDTRKDAIDHFNAESSLDFCFLLSTRAGGLGVNLATADTVVIFDSDWNPQNDLQAQARAHRIGQTKQVNIYRLVTKNSVEEDIVERAKKKMVLDHLVIQRMDTTGRTVLSQTAEPSRSMPFDKDDLNAILKFGVEDLFKEGEREGDRELQEMDIDDILQRAETQSAVEDTSAANELLSQFKMATFTLDEEELGEQALPTPTEGKSLLLTPTNESAPVQLDKSWDELIPASYRERVEEEERMKEQLQLYLPRRNRTVQNYCEDSPVKKRPTTEGRRQKRQPPPQRRREEVEVDVSKTVRGFSGNEIRRFVKSYRKFCNAKSRLDELAVDTEMQEKSISELERLLDTLHEGCVQAVTQHRARVEQNPEYDPKRDKGATLHLSGVAINASSILKREEELEGLATVIPANPDARKRYRMVTRAKPVAWPGVRWTAVEDAKLLIGVYEHGLGNWESIHSDPSLGLGKKILPSNKGMKPQSSHLQTRVEYLLKLLQEEAKHKVKKSTKPQPRRKAAVKSDKITKYLVEKPSSEPSTLTVNIPRDLLESERGTVKREGRKRPARSRSHNSPAKRARTSHPPPRTKPLNSVRRDEAEMGRREDATTPDIGDTELDSVTFQKCKSLLRPVKKYIKNLSPPEELSAEETVEHYKKVLVEIGDHIVTCLSKYKTEEQAMEWRTNLWVFVSKFTSSTPQKLHKIYKKARKEKHLAAVTMPVKKRYLEAATHDGHSHREHYHPGYRDAPSPQ